MSQPTKTLVSQGLGEFGRIARYFKPLATDPAALGLLDDAAVLPVPPGQSLVVTMDAIVEGVHFIGGEPPDLIARKLLRVNLSDLAAMGAVPYGYFLTTALPASCSDDWLAMFARGLGEDQAEFGLTLLGGDSVSTSGPICLTVTMTGMVPIEREIRRSGAKTGDGIFVSGTIGDGALGLGAARDSLLGLSAEDRAYLMSRYQLPQPRSQLGPSLRGIATAMLDVSDGLVADLGHITATSQVAAVILQEKVPLSSAAVSALKADAGLVERILTGGDDYELLFTASLEARPILAAISRKMGVAITEIGHVTAGQGVTVLGPEGRTLELAQNGWRHF